MQDPKRAKGARMRPTKTTTARYVKSWVILTFTCCLLSLNQGIFVRWSGLRLALKVRRRSLRPIITTFPQSRNWFDHWLHLTKATNSYFSSRSGKTNQKLPRASNLMVPVLCFGAERGSGVPILCRWLSIYYVISAKIETVQFISVCFWMSEIELDRAKVYMSRYTSIWGECCW